MAAETIGTCPSCGSWASLKDKRCSQCRAIAEAVRASLPRGEVVSVPIDAVVLATVPKVRMLASAGFSPARIAELLGADEADVRRVLG